MFCKYCGKECKNENSHRNHERLCPKNDNRVYKSHSKSKPSWNKGLTKETDERIRKSVETFKQNLKNGKTTPSRKGSSLTKEAKENLSKLAKEKKFGGCRYSKKFEYKGIILESSYELNLAIDLDKNFVSWIRPKPLIWLDKENKEHRYYPDFYLTEYNIYLDPKNDYLINNINPFYGIFDSERISIVSEQNNVKIIILRKNECCWEEIKKKIAPKALMDACEFSKLEGSDRYRLGALNVIQEKQKSSCQGKPVIKK